jgi:hypothetical protein
VADATACTGDSDHVARVQWHPLMLPERPETS